MDSQQINFFDNAAKDWDRNETKSTPEKINSILDKIEIAPGAKILDLGTGTGILIPYLMDRAGNNGEIVAIDISTGMLDIARKKYASTASNVKFVHADFEKESIEGRFDVIMLYCVYPHLENGVATLKKLMKNNIAEGGKIVIAFPTDETFINSIHKEKKVESDLLPPASVLARRLRDNTINAYNFPDSRESYIVVVEE